MARPSNALTWAAAAALSIPGALLAFLVARHLLRDAVRSRLGAALAPVDDGVRKDGTFCLATLRLVPVVPFWPISWPMTWPTDRIRGGRADIAFTDDEGGAERRAGPRRARALRDHHVKEWTMVLQRFRDPVPAGAATAGVAP